MTSFFIRSYGCSQNIASSERMAGLLQKAQFEQAPTLEQSDIVILNTCFLKNAIDAFFTEFEQIKQQHPYKILIIAGYLAQVQPTSLPGYSLIGTRSFHHIVEVVEESLNHNLVTILKMGEIPPLNLPKIRRNPLIEIIPLSCGSLNAACCSTNTTAQGNLKSYPLKDITTLARQAIKEGVKEIWLTSQDTTGYGFDLKTNLAQLLKELIAIPGDFKIRIENGSPEHLLKIKDELLPLLTDHKVFKILHLPVQSGSNKILQDMKRDCKREDFIALIQELRQKIPEITIETDILVGFPTETDEDFWQTQELIRKTNPEVINIIPFWPRSKTPAAKLKQIAPEVMARRVKIISDIFNNIARMQNERWLGWTGDVIINSQVSQTSQWLARNFAYKPVLVEGSFKLGEKVKVRIAKATSLSLKADVEVVYGRPY